MQNDQVELKHHIELYPLPWAANLSPESAFSKPFPRVSFQQTFPQSQLSANLSPESAFSKPFPRVSFQQTFPQSQLSANLSPESAFSKPFPRVSFQQTFPQSQLSANLSPESAFSFQQTFPQTQTLMVQLHALTSMPTLKRPSIGSHTTVWTPECSTHFVHPQAWNVAAIAAVELKTHMQFISSKGDVRPL